MGDGQELVQENHRKRIRRALDANIRTQRFRGNYALSPFPEADFRALVAKAVTAVHLKNGSANSPPPLATTLEISMTKYVGIGAFILLGIIVSFFTVSNRSVLKFNDATVDDVTAVDSQFEKITKLMAAYSDDKNVDAEILAKEIATAESEINSIFTKIEKVKVPDSELCRDFHGSVLNYTKNSLVIMSIYKDKVLPYIKLHNPPSEKDSSAVEDMLSASIAEDERLLEALTAAQAAMAKKYKFKLE